jgi:hypothetical protein
MGLHLSPALESAMATYGPRSPALQDHTRYSFMSVERRTRRADAVCSLPSWRWVFMGSWRPKHVPRFRPQASGTGCPSRTQIVRFGPALTISVPLPALRDARRRAVRDI